MGERTGGSCGDRLLRGTGTQTGTDRQDFVRSGEQARTVEVLASDDLDQAPPRTQVSRNHAMSKGNGRMSSWERRMGKDEGQRIEDREVGGRTLPPDGLTVEGRAFSSGAPCLRRAKS